MKTVYEGGVGEIVEKKSRFIASVRPVHSEEEATAFINEMKKKYWDARHNCSAFVIGEHQEMTRCSDDGEPAGTAGRPMLDVLLKEEITDVAVVVTRYFGGVLLGTGGLVRAYQGALHEGIANSLLLEKMDGFSLTVTTDYNGVGKLQYLFGQQKITIVDSEYGADVKMKVMIPAEMKEMIGASITDQTSGNAVLDWSDPLTYAFVDGEVILFS